MRSFFVLLIALLSGCASAGATRFQAIARDANGRVGFCAQVIETGEHLQLNATDHYPMQSVYKLAIAMTMLHDIDAGKFRLEDRLTVHADDYAPQTLHSPLRDRTGGREVRRSIAELIRLAVSESDGTASDVLLREIGSCDAVMRFLRSIDVDEVQVATSEKEMGADEQAQYKSWATPRGIVKLLIAVHNARGISSPSQCYLLRCMTNSQNSPKRIKGLLPPGTIVAHKTGLSRTIDGLTRATNDAGIVTLPDGRHLAIAVFVSDSPADNDTREAVIARITRAVYDQVTGASK